MKDRRYCQMVCRPDGNLIASKVHPHNDNSIKEKKNILLSFFVGYSTLLIIGSHIQGVTSLTKMVSGQDSFQLHDEITTISSLEITISATIIPNINDLNKYLSENDNEAVIYGDREIIPSNKLFLRKCANKFMRSLLYYTFQCHTVRCKYNIQVKNKIISSTALLKFMEDTIKDFCTKTAYLLHHRHSNASRHNTAKNSKQVGISSGGICLQKYRTHFSPCYPVYIEKNILNNPKNLGSSFIICFNCSLQCDKLRGKKVAPFERYFYYFGKSRFLRKYHCLLIKTNCKRRLKLERYQQKSANVLNEANTINAVNIKENYDELIESNLRNLQRKASKRHLQSLVSAHSVRKRTVTNGNLFANNTISEIMLHALDKVTNSTENRRHKVETLTVDAISESSASLPCTLKTNKPKDSVQLVLWIKEGMHTPLYSYDYREMVGSRPKETKPNANSTLSRRTYFRTESDPPVLVIDKVVRSDAGIYRCRVDFLLSPTRNNKVNLSVTVPTSRAKVTWKDNSSSGEYSVPSSEGIVGPLKEGEILTLQCTNDDGIPAPKVIWHEGDNIIDDTYAVSDNTGAVANLLNIGPLLRKDIGRRLTCQASNTNLTQPATTTVTVEIILKITSVEVEVENEIEAFQPTDIHCKVTGSRPPPIINWWIGNRKLESVSSTVRDEGNFRVSVLKYAATTDDDNSMLICKAINPKLPAEGIQDSKLLLVTYIPQVSISLGKSLDSEKIKEGDDVYFECSVKAKPAANRVQWKHNGNSLEGSPDAFVSNMSLVVQSVQRVNGGNYTCQVTNSKGTGVSAALHLDVKYAPVCATAQKSQHSVAKLENAEIACSVHANPSTVTFRWTFNNTAEAIDVPEGRFVVHGTKSKVNYTPMNELDYGTLLCWANNSIGTQKHPCVFQIVAAGKPDPPHNCRVYDITISSLQISCLAGDDGGLEQQFLLQVSKIGSISPITEIKNTKPAFSIANLRPATAYKIIVAALNEKGASRAIELKAYTLRVLASQEETSAEPARDRDRDKAYIPLAVIIGSSLAAVPAILIIVFVLWLKLCRKPTQRKPLDNINGQRSLSSQIGGKMPSEDSMQMRSRKDPIACNPSINFRLSTDSSNIDDCNPDVISHTPGEISTISTTSSSYFLGNGGTPFIVPSQFTPQMNMEHSERRINPENRLHPANHCQLVFNPQVPYLSTLQSKQSPLDAQLVDIQLPPPENYNQGYQSHKIKGKNANTGQNSVMACDNIPHNFPQMRSSQSLCPMYNNQYVEEFAVHKKNEMTFLHSDKKPCISKVFESKCHEYLEPLVSPNSLLFMGRAPCIGQQHLTTKTSHHLGTLRRDQLCNNYNVESSLSLKSSKNSLKGSLPDVRQVFTDLNDSSDKTKRESAV